MQKSLVLIVLLLISPRLIVSAQDRLAGGIPLTYTGIRIGVGLSGFANFTNWQTSAFMDSRYQIRPYLSRSFKLFLQEPVTNRLTIEAGLSYTQLGLASSVARNYKPGRRYEFTSTGRSQYNMFVLPVYVHYRLKERKLINNYLFLGTNVSYNDVADRNQFSQTTTTTVDMDTGDTLVIDERKRTLSTFSPAIVVGAGWEKRFSRKSLVTIRTLISVGLIPIVQTVLTVTALNRSRYYVPYSSTNELVNRGTYAGLELCYLFSFR